MANTKAADKDIFNNMLHNKFNTKNSWSQWCIRTLFENTETRKKK